MEKRIDPRLAEQIERTYPNRARPVEPSSYETEFQQSETREGWYPAPWFTRLAQLEDSAQPAAA